MGGGGRGAIPPMVTVFSPFISTLPGVRTVATTSMFRTVSMPFITTGLLMIAMHTRATDYLWRCGWRLEAGKSRDRLLFLQETHIRGMFDYLELLEKPKVRTWEPDESMLLHEASRIVDLRCVPAIKVWI